MIERIVEPDFGGHVGMTFDESRPAWPTRARPPAAARNIVLVVLDDVGYAQLGCYGSDIATPNIDRLASGGTQYTNFHVTPLCSPTRAALLSGRNHHTVGMGTITGFPGGFPNSREHINRRARTLPRLLREHGYGTYAVGKWHLMPMDTMTAAGRFDDWPLAHGFDQFYGFLGGEADQYRPSLVRDNQFVMPPDDDGYHLSEDLIDAADQMLTDHRSAAPTRPFFLYLAFGACHGPHQVPSEYSDRYRGRFDDGWDAARERWWRRQLELGVIPDDAALTPRNPDVRDWNELSPDERRLAARFHEVYAGFLEHTDAQVGRLLARLDELDATDDTVVVVMSDNGASGEGGDLGDWNEIRSLNGLAADVGEGIDRLDEIGSAASYPLYPRGWAYAGNTPLKWYKHYTFGGGVRAPLVIHGLPGATSGRVDAGFHHVVDVAPTLLDLCGLTAPARVDGVEQLPMAGRSILGDAEGAPRTQYFEMLGHRGLYHDGFKAVALHRPGASFRDEPWELYDLATDFSEAHDLAADRPELLRELVDRWWVEAGRYGVLPLDDRFLERAQDRTGTDVDGVTEFVLYRGMHRLPESAAPDLRAEHFAVRVPLRHFAAEHHGVLLSFGGRFGGFVWFVRDRRLVFVYNCFGARSEIAATDAIPDGDVTVGLAWHRTGDVGGPAAVSLSLDGVACGGGTVERTIPYYAGGNGIEVGANLLSVVAETPDRTPPFSGDFVRVAIDVGARDDLAGVATSRLRGD